jgi:hypothetical protein
MSIDATDDLLASTAGATHEMGWRDFDGLTGVSTFCSWNL